MRKKYLIFAIVYASLALVFGVFYREFTKAYEYTAQTTLSILHVHYLTLGMLFYLILFLFDKSINLSQSKLFNISEVVYNIGLNLMILFMLIKGILQVCNVEISTSVSGILSGFTGIAHAMLGTVLILILVSFFLIVKKQDKKKEN